MSENIQSFEDFLLECDAESPKKAKKLTPTAASKKTGNKPPTKGTKSKNQTIDSKQRSLNLFFSVKPKENGKVESESSPDVKKTESKESDGKAKTSNHKPDTNGQTKTDKSKEHNSKTSTKVNGSSSKSKKSSGTGKSTSPKVADDKRAKSSSLKSAAKTQSQQKLDWKKKSDDNDNVMIVTDETKEKGSKKRSSSTKKSHSAITITSGSDDDDVKEGDLKSSRKQKATEKEARKNEDKKKAVKNFFPNNNDASKNSKNKQRRDRRKKISSDDDDDVIMVKQTPPPAAKKNLLKKDSKKSRTEPKIEERTSRRNTRCGNKSEEKKSKTEEKIEEKPAKRGSIGVVDETSESKKTKSKTEGKSSRRNTRSVPEPMEVGRSGGKKRTSDIEQIQPLPLEKMWPSKYQPKDSRKMIGNPASVEQLCATLQDWKEKLLKQEKLEEKLEQKRSKKDDDDTDDDFHLSDEDSDDNCNKSPNVCVISGAVGCGKTSAVYACAKQLGFKVLEINASDVREGKRIMTLLHEASQSHNIGNNSKFILPSTSAGGSFGKKMKPLTSPKHNFFTKAMTSSSKQHNNEKHLARMSLVLFDEVDAVLPPDKAFWHTVKWFMNTSKTPVIITTTDISFLPSDLESRYLAIHMNPPNKNDLRLLIDEMLTEEHVTDAKRPKIDVNIDDVITTSRLHDVRSSIITSQFWYQTHRQQQQQQQKKKKRKKKKKDCERSEDLISNLPLNIVARMRTSQDVVDRCCHGDDGNGVERMSWLLDHHMSHLSSAGFRCLPRSTDVEQLGDTDMETMLKVTNLNCEVDVAVNILEKCSKLQQNTKLYEARSSTGGLYDGVEDQQALFNENPVTANNSKLLYEIQSYLQTSSIYCLRNKTAFPIACGDDGVSNINYRKLIHDEDRDILFEPIPYYLDRLPMLMNICKVEEIRKSAHQSTRRFRHYLLSFLSPLQIAQLNSTLDNC